MGAGTFQKVVRLGLKNERRRRETRESRRAKGAEGSRFWGGGVPLPQPTTGDRRELPQRGPGGAPAANAFLAYFKATEHCWWK